MPRKTYRTNPTPLTMSVQNTKTAEEIAQLFDNNFDCYTEVFTRTCGRCDDDCKQVMAMTKETFVQLFSKQTASIIESIEKVREEMEKLTLESYASTADNGKSKAYKHAEELLDNLINQIKK